MVMVALQSGIAHAATDRTYLQGKSMLVYIGLIIGIYAAIQLLALVTRRGDHQEHESVQILAFIGMVAILALCGVLWKQGAEASEQVAKAQAAADQALWETRKR